jgi:hypothetical protein
VLVTRADTSCGVRRFIQALWAARWARSHLVIPRNPGWLVDREDSGLAFRLHARSSRGIVDVPERAAAPLGTSSKGLASWGRSRQRRRMDHNVATCPFLAKILRPAGRVDPGTRRVQEWARAARGDGGATARGGRPGRVQGMESYQVRAREFGDQLLRRLLQHAQAAIPDVVGAGLSLVDKEGPRSVCAVGVAADLDPMQWTHGQGPLVDALTTGNTLVLPGPDGGFDVTRWPALAQGWGREGAPWPGGVVVSTGEWGSDGGQPVLFSLYTASVPGPSHVAELDRFEGLLANALAVVEYCAGEELRAEQMLQMVQYRRVIEQAKGMIMAVTGGDAAAAFTTLARASQHFNLRLRNLAVALVEHVGGSPAEGPQDPEQVVVPSALDRRTAAQVWAALARTADPDGPST